MFASGGDCVEFAQQRIGKPTAEKGCQFSDWGVLFLADVTFFHIHFVQTFLSSESFECWKLLFALYLA